MKVRTYRWLKAASLITSAAWLAACSGGNSTGSSVQVSVSSAPSSIASSVASSSVIAPSSVALSSSSISVIHSSSSLSSSSVTPTQSSAASVPSTTPAIQTFSFEQARLEGESTLKADSAYLGNGGTGSAVVWDFTVAQAGEYKITLNYSTPGSKVNHLVMGATATKLEFNAAMPTDISRVVSLEPGEHFAGLEARSGDWGNMNAHQLQVELLGSLTINQPDNFSALPSGADVNIAFDKAGTGALTYTVNDGAQKLYTGPSPLALGTLADGIYTFKFGLENTGISVNRRITVGAVTEAQFVETAGTQFVLGSKPFYFNGTNQYYLMYKPEQMAEDFFKRAKALDITVVRTWMFCNSDSTHDGACINKRVGSEFILTKKPEDRTAEEQALIKRSFELFDNYVALAEQHGIRLILSLADHWDFFGSFQYYAGGTGQTSTAYANAAARQTFKDYISAVINHRNVITGKKYNEDPTIMMWELANEPRPGSDAIGFQTWVDDIAAHVTIEAPKQLISIGMESSFGESGGGDGYDALKGFNSNPNIDAISGHLYPKAWTLSDAEVLGTLEQLAKLGRELNKPTYMGEFGWRTNVLREYDGADYIDKEVALGPNSDQAEVTAFVKKSLAQRTQFFTAWYAKAWELRDVMGGMVSWQLSGLEWGNGSNDPQWGSGDYGVYANGWSGNHDGYQLYCVLNDSEYSITTLGAIGKNMEGQTIHLQEHKPVCDLIKEYSKKYIDLNNL
ncbi:CBM35 domain-containing protein [Marinagarivorans algicola]|uniref:CBM35 domain-containing protein n=1 Tax=Marinagarivorans algicola TaxID=1513270 RepID=UPI000A8C9662|nr:CBM35 domain-containing protein [Marinagarivorans algicola]